MGKLTGAEVDRRRPRWCDSRSRRTGVFAQCRHQPTSIAIAHQAGSVPCPSPDLPCRAAPDPGHRSCIRGLEPRRTDKPDVEPVAEPRPTYLRPRPTNEPRPRHRRRTHQGQHKPRRHTGQTSSPIRHHKANPARPRRGPPAVGAVSLAPSTTRRATHRVRAQTSSREDVRTANSQQQGGGGIGRRRTPSATVRRWKPADDHRPVISDWSRGQPRPRPALHRARRPSGHRKALLVTVATGLGLAT
jgi:hypothetical protein